MTEAPDKIWANPDHWIKHPPRKDVFRPYEYVEYIRKDVSDALVSSAREKSLQEAAEWCRNHTMDVPINRQERNYAGMYCAGEWHSGSHAGLGYEAAILTLITKDAE